MQCLTQAASRPLARFVSTTHVLSSGVAGTMAANGSDLQWSTIKNMALAWVMTLPAAMVIAGSLYVILCQMF
jgi:PiT family inorganic phosphate transporter